MPDDDGDGDDDGDVIIVRSKYFASTASASPRERTDAKTVAITGTDDDYKLSTRHATLLDAVDAASVALESFFATAKVKNAHEAHERAAHEVLRHFRGTLGTLGTPREETTDAFDDPPEKRTKTEDGEAGKKKKDEEMDAEAREDAIGRAGDVLQNMLRETHRLHVNASCRVNTRAPEVKRARDNLTRIRREARELYKKIDPRGYERDRERVRMMAEETQAALDFKITRFETPPKDLAELRAKCPVMSSTGSPHHLCAHLCYYREYEPARQMYVLRCRAAEANGNAAALDGWRAELAVRPAEDIPAVNRSRADTRGTASGACSLKHLPWMVEFIGPGGERFKDGMDVLNFVAVECDKLSWPRASHGGNGVREARVSEDGLNDQTELLRAALWDEDTDGTAGTTPVRRSFTRIARCVDETRTPLRLAPDPLANENDENDDGEKINESIVLAAADAFDDETPGQTPTKTPLKDQQGGDAAASPPGSGPEPVRHWWAPPLSPFGLLEEILWQDEWKLLVSCMMLNCTTRLQVDRVLWRLFLLAPTAAAAVELGDTHEGLEALERIIAPLGLHRKRTNAFVKLSRDVEAQRAKYGGRIKNVSACHGVGVYAADAHALFVDGVLAGPPRDHALRWYHAWAHERRENAAKSAPKRT